MRFLIYFGWTILIGIIILTAATYQFLFSEKVQLNFNLIPVVISKVSLPIFAGILLRVPKLIHEIIQKNYGHLIG